MRACDAPRVALGFYLDGGLRFANPSGLRAGSILPTLMIPGHDRISRCGAMTTLQWNCVVDAVPGRIRPRFRPY
jgi:hypothetical protein